MDYLRIIVLGVVQGITEFLPISSDGHLLIANALLDACRVPRLDDVLVAEIALHAGTLISILVVFRQRIVRLLGADRRAIGLLIIGTLPAIPIGFAAYSIDVLHSGLESTLLAGLLLPVTGGLLLWAGKRQPGDVSYVNLTWRQALLIGVAQAVALLPGISRSGTTIVAGLAVGLRREAAATFSFLLAIPVIGGAVLLGLVDLLSKLGTGRVPSAGVASVSATTGAGQLSQLGVGALVSFIVGLGALALLLRWMRVGRLQVLAWWCIVLGPIVVIWQLI